MRFSGRVPVTLAACMVASATYASDDPTLANPAAEFCDDMEGRYEILTNVSGGAFGVCVLESGVLMDAWAYFRANGGEDTKSSD